VYRNGYIRKYAAFLDIPDEKIADVLESSAAGEPDLRGVFPMPVRRNLADKWLRATSYVLASLLIGTLAWQLTYEAVRLSQDEPQPAENATAAGPGGNAARDAADETVAASITPLGALHGGDDAEGDTAERAWAALARPPLAEGESRLQISVSADSWVEIVDAAGRELELDLLRGGSDKDYVGQPPFRILVGRAPAVHLFVDGQEVDLAAFTRDDVAQFTWPQPQDEQ
jgi:cytoskeleton protein RodZ